MSLSNIKGQKKPIYVGKVRVLYFLALVVIMKVSNRISAFDIRFKRQIPNKGQILNEVSAFFFELTKDIVQNCLIAIPTSTTQIWHRCERIDVEFIYRAYLDGSLWRKYKKGQRVFWRYTLPDGMKQCQKLPCIMFTPTTKGEKKDVDITEEEILARGLCTQEELLEAKQYGFEIFKKGEEYALSRGLHLVDTKFEFGRDNGNIMLIDEVLTFDSSRYYVISNYETSLETGQKPEQLSKEYFRQLLVQKGVDPDGPKDQEVDLSDEDIEDIRQRYIWGYKTLLGKEFVPANDSDKDYESTVRELKKLGIAA